MIKILISMIKTMVMTMALLFLLLIMKVIAMVIKMMVIMIMINQIYTNVLEIIKKKTSPHIQVPLFNCQIDKLKYIS